MFSTFTLTENQVTSKKNLIFKLGLLHYNGNNFAFNEVLPKINLSNKVE